MKGNKYMEQMKERINHLIYGRFEDGTGVYGKLFNVQKIEESAEKKPYYKLSINLDDKYCVILDTREIVNIYDFTEICSEMDSKLEDFGINPRFEKAEIMDEIILNWSGYTEEEKKKLSSLIRTKMDDDIIVNLMEKTSNLASETEQLKETIRKMDLSLLCLKGEVRRSI